MTRRPLHVGLSPCPNDTFIFHALLEGDLFAEELAEFQLVPVFEDVETLNQMARAGRLEVTKISFHAYGHLRESYTLLDAGSALGRGCGPLIVERPDRAAADLSQARVAIPGRWTSAALLLRLFEPRLREEQMPVLPFEKILAAVARGEVAAGLIIHESRFTFAEHGLVQRRDLGDWWEETQGLPIPLGGIIARRDLGAETIARVDRALAASVRHARAHPEDSRDWVRSHAQELSDEVTRAHIDLYVNEFTESLGAEGRAAIAHLFAIAEANGIIPRPPAERDRGS